jgi:superfamily I DNA/RNA helicase
LLNTQRLFDYEDLVFGVVRLFEQRPEVLADIRSRVSALLVDEYQDLNYGQYRLIRQLSPMGDNLFVIGDPDQSIYGFRGSDVRFFNRFMEDYPRAEIIRLTQNYRTVQPLLDAAGQLIDNGRASGIEAAPVRSGIPAGPDVLTLIETHSERSEAVAVGKNIERLVGGIGFHSSDMGRMDSTGQSAAYGFGDICVLCRTRSQGVHLEEILRRAGIPCQNINKTNRLYRKHLRSAIALMKWTAGAATYVDIEHLGIGLGIRLSCRLKAFAIEMAIENHLDLQELLHRANREALSGWKKKDQARLSEVYRRLKRLERTVEFVRVSDRLRAIWAHLALPMETEPEAQRDIAHLEALAEASGSDIGAFLSRIALQTDPDLYDPRVQKVNLMTMHAAKGLEFPVVFITGCEDELIPLRPPDGPAPNLDEERRLLYVAMTRAKERLFLSWSRNRRILGRRVRRRPSPFVEDVADLVGRRLVPQRPLQPSKIDRQVQLKLF